MSIATAIQAAQQKVADAYTAASAKGATMPTTQNLSNLATTIGSISTAPARYTEKVNNNGVLENTSQLIDLTGVTDVGYGALSHQYAKASFPANTTIGMSGITTVSGTSGCQYTFYYTTGITSVDLSSLTIISGIRGCDYMFQDCANLTSVDLSSLTTVSGNYGCECMFQDCANLTSVDLSSLTTVSGNYGCADMFNACTNLTSVDLSSLTTVSGNYGCLLMFQTAHGLTSVDLSSLTSVSGQNGCRGMFNACANLTSVDLSSLTSVSGQNGCLYMFQNCANLTSVDLSSLTIISGSQGCAAMFYGCTSLTSLSFPSLTNNFGSYTNQFVQLLQDVIGCTVHFPSNLQSVIGSWASITAGFGGTNTTILFDLPATVTLTGVDSVTYTRNPKYDTATALAWKVGAYGTTNFTPAYYTNGTTDPVAGDTIYSDSACTTAITNISSIA